MSSVFTSFMTCISISFIPVACFCEIPISVLSGNLLAICDVVKCHDYIHCSTMILCQISQRITLDDFAVKHCLHHILRYIARTPARVLNKSLWKIYLQVLIYQLRYYLSLVVIDVSGIILGSNSFTSTLPSEESTIYILTVGRIFSSVSSNSLYFVVSVV